MSALEKFIKRHTLARYIFVLVTFPIVAISDRVNSIWNPVDTYDLRNALRWARTGGEPPQERPEPAPMHPKWQQHGGDTGSYGRDLREYAAMNCADDENGNRS